ncbi:multiple epidermal growth factor-like domains protein 11 [Mytilus californianus]|uniref:multiple epidermal growth factor-like domains protein 11 n=1 Tax=Mytilus californianus TaxID=6549 RepID=UPI0022465689|nr:multiple epidermal growth factor-like domains protein 11 [Mytilus californianus]
MIFTQELLKIIYFHLLCISSVSTSINLAEGRETRQSSTLQRNESGLAVDGIYTTCASTNQQDERNLFWQLTLAENASITHIRYAYYYDDQDVKYLLNTRIYVSSSKGLTSGQLCYTETRNPNEIDPIQNKVFCFTQGTYLTYYNPDRRMNIKLCEVEVYGCPIGRYGDECSDKCSSNCLTQPCEPDFGRCTDGCKSGFSGERCTSQCGLGVYGPNCVLTCSVNCLNNDCDSVNGTCKNCVDGFMGAMCDFMGQVTDSTVLIDQYTANTSQTKYWIVIAVLALALILLIVIITYFKFGSSRIRVKKEKISSKLSHVSYENSPRLTPPQNNTVDYDSVQYETFQEKGNRKSNMYDLPVTSMPSQQVVNATAVTKTGFHNSKQGVNKPPTPKKPIKPPKSLVKEFSGAYEGLQSTEHKHFYDSLNQ